MLEGWIYGVCMSGEAPSPVVFGFGCHHWKALPKELWSGTPVMAKDSVDWEIQGCSSVSIRSLGISQSIIFLTLGRPYVPRCSASAYEVLRDQVGPVWGFLEAAGFQWCGMAGVAHHIWFLCGSLCEHQYPTLHPSRLTSPRAMEYVIFDDSSWRLLTGRHHLS